jgi:hypothetical protein
MLALLAPVVPSAWLWLWRGGVRIMAVLAPALAFGRAARAVTGKAVSAEFDRWFQPWPDEPAVPDPVRTDHWGCDRRSMEVADRRYGMPERFTAEGAEGAEIRRKRTEGEGPRAAAPPLPISTAESTSSVFLSAPSAPSAVNPLPSVGIINIKGRSHPPLDTPVRACTMRFLIR